MKKDKEWYKAYQEWREGSTFVHVSMLSNLDKLMEIAFKQGFLLGKKAAGKLPEAPIRTVDIGRQFDNISNEILDEVQDAHKLTGHEGLTSICKCGARVRGAEYGKHLAEEIRKRRTESDSEALKSPGEGAGT